VNTTLPPALQGRDEWRAAFRAGWLAHYRETGQIDWKRYVYPDNQAPVPGPGVDLRRARLALITSSGAYHAGRQPPFDAQNPLGDYTIRAYPLDTPPDEIDYAHTHYDQGAVRADPQVLIPLDHLQEMVREGAIGELAPSVIHFMGYQPDASRVVDETAPALLEVLKAEGVRAALLVPA
jgi:D-proline reductase (dithiol) PrdB